MSGNGSSPPSGVDPAERSAEESAAERVRPRTSGPERTAPAPAGGPPPAGSDAGERDEAEGDGPGREGDGQSLPGYHLYGVVRSRSWARWRDATPDGLIRIGHGDLEALVHRAPFHVPELDPSRVREHQRLIEAVMRGGTILPAPYGVVFRGRRGVKRFLSEQYLTLDEALSFLRGRWELRLHISVVAGAQPGPDRDERAMHIYSELRRSAHAAIPFPARESRVLSAAFLVDRGVWIDFIDRAHALAAGEPDLTIDVTGPWPPYDFVRLVG